MYGTRDRLISPLPACNYPTLDIFQIYNVRYGCHMSLSLAYYYCNMSQLSPRESVPLATSVAGQSAFIRIYYTIFTIETYAGFRDNLRRIKTSLLFAIFIMRMINDFCDKRFQCLSIDGGLLAAGAAATKT